MNAEHYRPTSLFEQFEQLEISSPSTSLVGELGESMTPAEILGLMRFARTGEGPLVAEFESALRQLPEAYPEQASQLAELLGRSEDEQDRQALDLYFSPPSSSE